MSWATNISEQLKKANLFLWENVNIAPLVVFRILFGLLLAYSSIRFLANGWVESLYLEPSFYFTYYGFDWVSPLGAAGMYAVFIGLIVSGLCIALGLFYRVTAVVAFLLFTYVELLDKTNYLNHYYFVSIVLFLLVLLPASRAFSMDVRLGLKKPLQNVPRYTIWILKMQLAIVYFFAGLAKLNADWLLDANPLKIWLPMHGDLPLVGSMMDSQWLAYGFSWAGAAYDLCIPFLLFSSKFRKPAFALVVFFHVITWLLFPIGVFPWVMICSTMIFFDTGWHQNVLKKLGWRISYFESKIKRTPTIKWITTGLIVYLLVQLILPFRFMLYPGDLFWHEQGFRFSWRVMLVEKMGYAEFRLKNAEGKTWVADNDRFLTPNQERMMSTQPDMILQYAHFLKEYYQSKGEENVEVYADVYVSLNGRRSQKFVDASVDLGKINRGYSPKTWLLPLKES